jgi:prevent-host-death family protein
MLLNVDEAQARFDDLIDRARAGEDVVIVAESGARVRLVPVASASQRSFEVQQPETPRSPIEVPEWDPANRPRC